MLHDYEFATVVRYTAPGVIRERLRLVLQFLGAGRVSNLTRNREKFVKPVSSLFAVRPAPRADKTTNKR